MEYTKKLEEDYGLYKLYTFVEKSYVHFAEVPLENIDKLDFALCNQPTERPNKYRERQEVTPDIVSNGGFFGMSNGVTVFNFVDEGTAASFNKSYQWGIGIQNEKDILYSSLTSRKWRDFIGGYPVLLDNYRKCSYDYAKDINYNARRTAVGYNDTSVILLVVDKPEVKIPMLQDIMLAAGCKYAINLDGGGSTYMECNGEKVTSESYIRPVDNVFCIYLKKPKPTAKKCFYRVQVGAFLISKNANNLVAELRNRGFTGAFIAKSGLIYRVQIGAYSQKLNADRMADTLKGHGYKPFVTKVEQ